MLFGLLEFSLLALAVFLDDLKALVSVPFLQMPIMFIPGDIPGQTMLRNVFGIFRLVSDSGF